MKRMSSTSYNFIPLVRHVSNFRKDGSIYATKTTGLRASNCGVTSIFNVAPTIIKQRRRFGRAAAAAALRSGEYFSLNNNSSYPSSSLFVSAFLFSFSLVSYFPSTQNMVARDDYSEAVPILISFSFQKGTWLDIFKGKGESWHYVERDVRGEYSAACCIGANSTPEQSYLRGYNNRECGVIAV
jgi:hypothetical protein